MTLPELAPRSTGACAVSWTGPKELKAQLARLWERGELLDDAVTGHARFPLRLSSKSPNSADITDRFKFACVCSIRRRLWTSCAATLTTSFVLHGQGHA
jgi:hypothetical protein